jgi:hypothetical protein
VALVPAQTADGPLILIVVAAEVFTIIEMPLDETLGSVTQVALEVSRQVTRSLLFNVDEE